MLDQIAQGNHAGPPRGPVADNDQINILRVNQFAHFIDGLSTQSAAYLARQVFTVQYSSVGSNNRRCRSPWSNCIDRHHHIGFDGATVDVFSQLVSSDPKQLGRCTLMQFVPPCRFGCFSNIGFVLKYNFLKLGFQFAIDTANRLLNFANEFIGVIFKNAGGNLAAQRSPQHDDLKRAYFVGDQPLAFQWL